MSGSPSDKVTFVFLLYPPERIRPDIFGLIRSGTADIPATLATY